MSLVITGTVIQVMPTANGKSKSGKEWSKREFVIETKEQYPKKVCISQMGGPDKPFTELNPGDSIDVSLNIESREYQGKWYTNVNAWRIAVSGSTNSGNAESTQAEQHDSGMGDDLPF